MSFGAHTTSYGSRPPRDRYARAVRAWDERIGTARQQAFHWRLVGLLSLVLLVMVIAGFIFVAARKQVKTYVVEVDQVGMPARITLADEHYQPDDAQVGYFVGQLVRLVRERPLDPVLIRRNWETAYGFLAGPAVNTMNAYAAQDSGLLSTPSRPIARIVEISNILQKAAGAYQVRWVETEYVGGFPEPRAQYTGLFHTKLKPPRDESDVFHNPLGVYVVSFAWSREFTDPIGQVPVAVLPPASQPSPFVEQDNAEASE